MIVVMGCEPFLPQLAPEINISMRILRIFVLHEALMHFDITNQVRKKAEHKMANQAGGI